MLDRLNTIDWRNLNADKIPTWIISLISCNKDERYDAGAKLLEYFCQHAEALGNPDEYKEVLSTDAAVHAAPFFATLLSSSEAPDKAIILSILTVLAGYRNREGLEKVHQVRAEKIYQHLLANFDSYVPFLYSQDSHIRTHAMYLVSKFDEKAEFTSNALIQLIEMGKEQDEREKTVTAEIIFEKIQRSPETAELLSEQFIRALRRWIMDEHV